MKSRHFICLAMGGLYAILGLTVSVNAQSYRVYRPESNTLSSVPVTHPHTPLLSVYPYATLSYGAVKDQDGATVSRLLEGVGGRVFISLSSQLAIGAQVAQWKATDMSAGMIQPIRRTLCAGVGRWVITADTKPQLYIELGAGQVRQKTKFTLRSHTLNGTSPVLLAGIGIDWALGKGLYITGAYQWQYETHRWENFALKGPRVRQELSGGIGYRF